MNLLLTAAPGTGKTTVIRRLGEYTTEIRTRGERRGFRMVGYDGTQALIAHVELPKTHSVGKYGVDVDAIDHAVSATLTPQPDIELYLVDEIGKMECLSERFVAAMRRILDSRTPVIATVASRGLRCLSSCSRG